MYCDIADVRRRTPSITLMDIPDHVVESYIEEGQDVVDTWLRKIYSVPFDPVPLTIKRICADIAAYFLMRDFPDKTFSDDLERLEKAFKADLQDIVDGNVVLSVDQLDTSSQGAFVYVIESPGDRWGGVGGSRD